MGMFHLLPLLRGWEYRSYTVEKYVERGADPVELRSIYTKGWLLYLEELTNDCYGTLMVEYQGAELETRVARILPEFYVSTGAFVQDPSGWCMLYRRPNPASTAGVYDVIAFSGGFQGAVWPYVPTVVMKLVLPEESTQESAYIYGYAGCVEITDDKAFTESLREVLGFPHIERLLEELIQAQKGGGR